MAGQSFASLFLCALLPLVRAQTSWTVGQSVKTTSGTLIGTHAANNSDVSLYAGIPFAKAPIGDLRWASPQPYSNTSTINATTFGAGCAANSLATGGAAQAVLAALGTLAGSSAINNLLSIGGIGGAQSEDCLYLNVWTKPQVGEDKKAVLIWIYGGGFQFGTSNSKTYNGEYFVEDEDVVVVSINYRTNVFGFPGLPGTSSATQNPGLEDQRLAIEWVRDNIAAFHGDPDRITIFGESAGAASVDYYQYAYVDDPIIAGSIAESGSALSFFDPVKLNNTADWYNMSTALGCGGSTTSPDESLACLRNKTTAEVLNVTQIYDPLVAILGHFQPSVDEKVVFSDYPTRGKNGDFIKKPYFTGNNNYEAGIFKFLAYNATPPISDNSWDVFDLLIFTCPTMDAANVRYEAGSPVWRYRYFGEFPNERLTIAPNSGAYHASEIGVVFETSIDSSGAANTANETIISEYMNKLWADFAKDPETAFSSRDLPQYNPNEKTLIYFGVNNETEPWVVYTNNTDESCNALVSTIATLGGTNALTSDPEGFNAKYGSLADQLHGFVGIGDSNHADAPFGPPPIASLAPTSTPSFNFSSTSAAGTGTGTAPAGTGVTSSPPTNSTIISTISTGVVPPINGTVPGSGSGSFITVTKTSATSVTTAPGGGPPTVTFSVTGSIPSGPGPVSSVSASASSPGGTGSIPPYSIPPPPYSANTSAPVGTASGTTFKPSGTGAGTGTSGFPTPSANSTVVDPPPPLSTSAPLVTSSATSTPPVYSFSLPTFSLPSLGGYGGYLEREVDGKLEKERKDALDLFHKIYNEQKIKKRIADWKRDARPVRLQREVLGL